MNTNTERGRGGREKERERWRGMRARGKGREGEGKGGRARELRSGSTVCVLTWTIYCHQIHREQNTRLQGLGEGTGSQCPRDGIAAGATLMFWRWMVQMAV